MAIDVKAMVSFAEMSMESNVNNVSSDCANVIYMICDMVGCVCHKMKSFAKTRRVYLKIIMR